MALVKKQAAGLTTAIFRFDDVERRAAEALDKARAEADALLIEARREAEAIKRRAADEGRAAGLAEGREQGVGEGREAGRAEAFDAHADELGQLTAALAGLLGEFERHRHDLKENVAADVTRLALAVAEKVTKRQGVIDPGVMAANVAAVARMVADGHDLRVLVHPDQQQLLNDLLPRLAADWPALRHAVVEADPDLSPGGCRLGSAAGSIDADLATQLDRLAAELLPEPA